MSLIDKALARAYAARDSYKQLRELFGEAKKQREEGRRLAEIGRSLIGQHLDHMTDSRDRVRGRRVAAVREYIAGPRPEYRVITAEEFERQKEIARELIACDSPERANDLVQQALDEAIRLMTAHDTVDVMEDIEPLVEMALDAHEQVIAWYEGENLRMPFLQFKEREKAGAPPLAVEFVSKTPVAVVASEVRSDGTAATPDAPTPEAAPAVETSPNPTSDPT